MIFKSIIDRICDKIPEKEDVWAGSILDPAIEEFNKNNNIHSGYTAMVCMHELKKVCTPLSPSWLTLWNRKRKLRKALPEPSMEYQEELVSYLNTKINERKHAH